MIQLICRTAFEKDSVQWQYLFGVVEQLKILGMKFGSFEFVASFVGKSLVTLFEPLDKKSEQGKKFKDLFDRNSPKPREMMAQIISVFVDLQSFG